MRVGAEIWREGVDVRVVVVLELRDVELLVVEELREVE